jgi:hypothetical protein
MRPPARTLAAGLLAALALLPREGRALALQRHGDDDDFTARRDTTVVARGARRVEIEGRAGTLRVVGVAGAREVRVRGTARASREEWLRDIRLVARREGDAVVVRADIPEWNGDDWRDGGGHRALDLVVEVPRGIAARVEDGSGELAIRGVGALDLRDGSGSVEIDEVESAVIVDGSGSLRVRDVRGDVRVEDGSGSVEVERVGGTVTVERDGSGSIDVRTVAGDFVVERDGSGGIDHDGVRGRVSLPRMR